MLRCYLGGALQEEIAEKDAETLETLVRNDLQKIMGINETPIFCKVFQNHKSNVQYHVNHSERIDSIMEDLKNFQDFFSQAAHIVALAFQIAFKMEIRQQNLLLIF